MLKSQLRNDNVIVRYEVVIKKNKVAIIRKCQLWNTKSQLWEIKHNCKI